MNGTQERMRYLRQLQNHIIERVFIDKRIRLAETMHVIAQENQKLLRCNSPTFRYNEQWWPYETVPDPTCNKELHSSLREKVSLLLDDLDFDDRDIRAGIESLVGNALALARHTEDLQALLPQHLSMYVSTNLVLSSIFNIGDPLSPEEVAEFMEANQANTKFLKKMLITRLLMGNR